MASSAVDTELETLIRARYPIIYIVSWEEKRVEDALRAIAQARGKKVYFWTITQGMALNPNHRDNATKDPMAALDFVIDSRDQALFVLKDFHAFINDVTLTRRLRDLTLALKTSYKTLIILAPLLRLPNELEKEVTVIDYGLPDIEDLDQILEKIIQTVKDNPKVNTVLAEVERDQVLKAAQGLTAMEAENVFAKSLVEKHKFDVDVILSEKEQIIRKSGILEYYPFNEQISDVGGLDLLKDWMEKRTVAFTEKARNFGLPAPRGVLLLGVQGCGKCFEKGTPVLMYDGSVKAVQNVATGDCVMGLDSMPRRVLGTTQGYDEMYRVTPTKGEPYTVNADHILTLRLSGSRRTHKQADENLIINMTVREYMTQNACFKQRALGYRAGVEFPAASVVLDPYFLGVWLGDGTEKSPSITTEDAFIVEYVSDIAAQYGLGIRKAEKNIKEGQPPNRAATYFVTGGNQGGIANPLLSHLRELNLLGNKHIPLSYKANSRETRLRLLAGIIDTDGCMQGNDFEIIQKRKTLADDIAYVARSLGLAAYVHPCRKYCMVKGVKIEGTYHRIHISGDTDIIPVRLHRKQALPRQQRKNVLNTGIQVEAVGPGQYFGFAVDGDHRFLLGDFTVVHNSLSAKAIGCLWRLPLLRLDVGRIFGGIVGQSEENMRKAIRVAESVAPCVSGETRITLADGSERPIAELYDEADSLEVLSMTPDYRLAATHVRAITRREAPDLFAVKTAHGSLNATGNHQHPVLRDGDLRWVRTDELQTTDCIAAPREIPTCNDFPVSFQFLTENTRLYAPNALNFARAEIQTPQRRYRIREQGADYVSVRELANREVYPDWRTITAFRTGHGGTSDSELKQLPEKLNAEVGYLLGLITSDGFLGKRGRICFVNTDLALHKRFAGILCEQFGFSVSLRLTGVTGAPSNLRGTSKDSVFEPCYVSYSDCSLLRDFLNRVQDSLLTLPKEFLTAWIRGYFDGDGFIFDSANAVPKIVLTSKIPTVNHLVRAVLHRVGFSMTNAPAANIEISGIQNVRRFIAQVGSDHPRRAARMEDWLQKPLPVESKDRTDAIPVGAKLRRVRQGLGMGSQRFERSRSGLIHLYEWNKAHPNRARLLSLVAEMQAWADEAQNEIAPEVLRELSELAALAESPSIAWSRVQSVMQIETPQYVYDLCCEENHNFIADGLITHNCVLWLDELEKGFSGTQSSGQSDGGTTSRVFGTFLTWMQDKKAATFVVATSNDVTSLPPELLRKGRFDDIFFIDLPSKGERVDIFHIHLGKRKRNPDDFDLNRLADATPGFSGAEIEAVVIEALYNAFDETKEMTTDSIITAVRQTVPLSMTMRERIEDLREWAEQRARQASSAQSENMATIAEELIVAKHNDAVSNAAAIEAATPAPAAQTEAPLPETASGS